MFFAYDYNCCPQGDFTGDCIVDMKDFVMLARDWLTGEPDCRSLLEAACLTGGIREPVPWDSPADADGNKRVDFGDLCILADSWLQTSAPPDVRIEAGAEAVARGLSLLADNWTGRLADNKSAEPALQFWKQIATNMRAPRAVRSNWRLEMFLTKAFIDAQVKRKYDAEMQYQRQAYQALRQADVVGVSTAVSNALAALARIDTEFQSESDFKREIQSWGITGRYGELDKALDNMYHSLSDRQWLESRLAAVNTLADIQAILNYEDPGAGGFYDNLGVDGMQPHLVRQRPWQQDPGFVHSPIEWNDHDPDSTRRQSQMSHAVCRYDTPLLMRWHGLDPTAAYHIEVVYRGPFGPHFTCKTDDGYTIHGSRANTASAPVSYSIPHASTSDGALQLQWQLTNIVRGVSVTEIWLIRD